MSLPPPDYAGPSGTGDYFSGYTAATVRRLLEEARRMALEEAAQWMDKRRADFLEAHATTDPDTGAIEFGRGQHALAKAEYVGELEEISEALRALKDKP